MDYRDFLNLESNQTYYCDVVDKVIDQIMPAENLIDLTANILNSNPTWNTKQKIGELLSMFRPTNLSPVAQLRECINRINIVGNQLGFNISNNTEGCPQLFNLGSRFNIVKVRLFVLPKNDEEFNVWNEVTKLATVQEIEMDPNGDDYDDRILLPLRDMPLLKTLKLGHRLYFYQRGFPNLTKLTQLQELDISCHTTDQMTADICHLTALNTLTLSNSSIFTAGLENIAKITSLQKLAMAMTNLHGDYTALSQLKKLRRFINGSEELNTKSMQELSKCPLEYLDLSYVRSRESLQAIFQMHDLNTLRLREVNFSDDEWNGIENLTKLHTLELIRCEKLQGAVLGKIARLPNLVSLNLRDCNNLHSGYKKLQRLTNLRRLNISSCQIPKEAFEAIAKLPLVNLDASENEHFDDEAVFHLVQRCQNLKELTVSRTQITNEGLAQLPRLSNLQSVGLRLCKLSFQGLLNAIPEMLALKTFHSSISSKEDSEIISARRKRNLLSAFDDFSMWEVYDCMSKAMQGYAKITNDNAHQILERALDIMSENSKDDWVEMPANLSGDLLISQMKTCYFLSKLNLSKKESWELLEYFKNDTSLFVRFAKFEDLLDYVDQAEIMPLIRYFSANLKMIAVFEVVYSFKKPIKVCLKGSDESSVLSPVATLSLIDHSPFFKNLFCGDLKRSTGVYELDLDEESLDLLIQATQDKLIVDDENVFLLHFMGHQFLFQKMVDLSAEYLKKMDLRHKWTSYYQAIYPDDEILDDFALTIDAVNKMRKEIEHVCYAYPDCFKLSEIDELFTE